MFSREQLHIIGDDSGCGSLIGAGVKRQNIVQFRTCQNMMGPICNQIEPEKQFDWLEEHAPGAWESCGLEASDVAACHAKSMVQFDMIERWTGPTTIWFSSRNIAEFSFYLAIVFVRGRAGGLSFVDVAHEGLTSTGECPPQEVHAFWNRRFELNTGEIEQVRRLVKALDAESVKLLHLHREGEIADVPINFFDPFILGHIDQHWRSLHEVAQQIIGAGDKSHPRKLDIPFLVWRLNHLRKIGAFEFRERVSQRPQQSIIEGEVRISRQ